MLLQGLIVKSTGSWYTVETQDNEYIQCRLKGKFKIKGIKTTNPIAVGDRVMFSLSLNDPMGVIEEICERKNYIIRKSVNLSKQTHIIASNLDQTVIIASLLNPRTSTGFIDRLTVTSEAYHIPVKIIFNKYDTYDAKYMDKLNKLMALYENVGYACMPTSAETNYNTELFKDLLKDKISLVAGHSGVGKSALLNLIEPGLNLKTSTVSTFNNKGRHTTTFAQMYKLSFGGYVVDTPGIKEFGLVDFTMEEVAHYFPEMRSVMQNCKFSNCTHNNEPGCAVKEHVSQGLISETRYQNYLNIINNSETFEKDYID